MILRDLAGAINANTQDLKIPPWGLKEEADAHYRMIMGDFNPRDPGVILRLTREVDVAQYGSRFAYIDARTVMFDTFAELLAHVRENTKFWKDPLFDTVAETGRVPSKHERLKALPQFRWGLGMVTTSGEVVVDITKIDPSWIPDCSHPATFGYLYQICQELWGEFFHVSYERGKFRSAGARIPRGSISLGIERDTIWEVLVAAISLAEGDDEYEDPYAIPLPI